MPTTPSTILLPQTNLDNDSSYSKSNDAHILHTDSDDEREVQALIEAGFTSRSSQTARTAETPLSSPPALVPGSGSSSSQHCPPWMIAALEELMQSYPNDLVDIILHGLGRGRYRQPLQWRLKCLDCPGKLYTPGAGETLNNFSIHLRNRQHRARVLDRLNRTR